MRITEKTIELTFAAQCAAMMPAHPIWFGLTQQQEARLGFDACTRMNAAMLLFQFKASSGGTAQFRRYKAPHDQLQHLQLLARNFPSLNIFYVFPRVEDSTELAANPDLLSECLLVDVRALKDPMPVPTNRDGPVRKSFCHEVELDLHTDTIVFHSEPVLAKSANAQQFLEAFSKRLEPVSNKDKENIFALVGAFSGAAVGILAPIGP
jgi:hypothetical protein